MRAFLAIELPGAIRECYRRALTLFEERLLRIRWVQPECLHVTLRFLGEVDAERLRTLEMPMRSVAAGLGGFRLSIGRAGAFGPPVAPRVFWFAVKEGRSELVRIHRSVEDVLAKHDFPSDTKDWTPHVTVGRTEKAKRKRLSGPTVEQWEEAAIESGLTGLWFDVGEITLLSSLLRPSGPLYSRVWAAPLGGAGDASSIRPVS